MYEFFHNFEKCMLYFILVLKFLPTANHKATLLVNSQISYQTGKTTYCNGMSQFMRQMGRNVAIVNLDFANEQQDWNPDVNSKDEGVQDSNTGHETYSGESESESKNKDTSSLHAADGSDAATKRCAVDVRQLVSLERVMEEFHLGPNGGLVYCIEYLLEHADWLVEQLSSPALADYYILFDCPGQVELYTHHTAVHDLVQLLSKRLDFRLCSVHLLDSFYCCEPATFVGAVLSVASTMLRLSLPHVNVLTKVDLLPLYGPLPFTLDFYTEMHDLTPLLRYIDRGHIATEEELGEVSPPSSDSDDQDATAMPSRPRSRLARMTGELCSVLSDFGLLSFLPLNIQDASTVGRVLITIDRANGYTFAAQAAMELRQKNQHGEQNQQEKLRTLFHFAAQDLESTYERSLEVYEKYVDTWEREKKDA